MSTLRLLYLEAAVAVACETWIGSSYLSGLAGEAGVSARLVALFSGATLIGSVGQILGIWGFARLRSIRSYTLGLTVAARALWVGPLAAALFWGWSTYAHGARFPARSWFHAAALVACLSAALSAAASTSWMSWMSGLVPGDFRGRFFGTRQRFVMLGLLAADLVGAAAVAWKPAGFFAGYAALGLASLVFGTISASILVRIGDAPGRGPEIDAIDLSPGIARILSEPFRDPAFRGVLLFGVAFTASMQVASPFFPYYFTKELGLPMRLIAIWSAIASLGALAVAAALGRHIDREGSPRHALWIGTHLMALSPLAYLVSSAAAVRMIAPVEYFVNGGAWVAYNIGSTVLLLSRAPAGRNLAYFSLYAAASGLAGAGANALGAHLSEWLVPWGGFRALWLCASLLRLVALWLFLRPILRGGADGQA